MTEIKTTTKKVSKAKPVISLEAPVYSQKGVKTTTIALPEKVFGLKWNADLVHQVVVGMMANKRAGTAHTKDRSEVSGGGKKPWKQKGTGRARHGSSRSPIWSGGGVTFGPRNDKDYSQKINKKTRIKALFTVLSHKYALGSILFVDTLSLSVIKTKGAAEVLAKLATVESFEKINSSKKTGTLMVLPETSDMIEKSFANLPGVTLVKAADLNSLILMNFRHVIMVDPSALVPVFEAKMK
jgi:large subunit ribosomal protein L4